MDQRSTTQYRISAEKHVNIWRVSPLPVHEQEADELALGDWEAPALGEMPEMRLRVHERRKQRCGTLCAPAHVIGLHVYV